MEYMDIAGEFFQRYPALVPLKENFLAAFSVIRESFQQKGKLLVCGNGGSAADSDHITAELMKGFKLERKLPPPEINKFGNSPDYAYITSHLQGALPAISLAAHTSLITALANDVAPDMVFAQQVYGYGVPGDVLFCLSTSGNSGNVLMAAKTARPLGLKVVSVCGYSGGLLKDLSDVCIQLPEHQTAAVQELTLPLYHALCGMLEHFFFRDSPAVL